MEELKETKRFKNRIKKESGLPAVATVLAALSLGCVCAIYWPVFAKFNAGGLHADETVYPLTVIYGLLFSALLLYAVFTGALAKKTLIPAAIFSVPVFLYYFIEKVGVLEYLVFHTDKDLFFVYENNPLYYSGQNLLWIVLASVFSLLAMLSFLMLCFHKKKGKLINTLIVILAFAVRLYYSYYHLAHNEFPLYASGEYALADIVYAVLGHAAGALFFASVLLLTFAMHKTEIEPKHLRRAAATAQAAPAQTADAQAAEPFETAAVPTAEAAPQQAAAEPVRLAEISYNPFSGEMDEQKPDLTEIVPAQAVTVEEAPAEEAATEAAAAAVSAEAAEPESQATDADAADETENPQTAVVESEAEKPGKPKRARKPKKAKAEAEQEPSAQE